MEIIVAKTAGFCFGVKRAVETVYREIESGGKVYTYGEIIHNEQVVADLEAKGVRVINSTEEIALLEGGTVIIRSHGVGPDVYEAIDKNKSLRLVDATCPFVSKIHKIVASESSAGREIVVIGDGSHPEVQGIMAYSKGDVTAIKTAKEAEDFNPKIGIRNSKGICVVSQTTFNFNKFQELVEILSKKGYSINTVNTICSATEQRQKEAVEIASKADAMLVIGGKHSSNTRKLYEICSDACRDSRLIQTKTDLDLEFLSGKACVGITAGASTPNYIIEEVQGYVRGTDF